MKFIPTKVHAVIDYLAAIFLAAMPWLLNFAHGGAETWVPVFMAVVVILYSLLTDYELGAGKVFSMRTHLILDVLGAVFLAASPWLFGFADYIYKPHLVVGILEIVVVLVSRTHSPVENDLHRVGAKTPLTTS